MDVARSPKPGPALNETRPQAGRRSTLLSGPLQRMAHYAKWLRLGLRVKRWLLVALWGIFLFIAGVDLMFLLQLADLGDRLNEVVFTLSGKTLSEEGPIRALTYQVMLGAPMAALGVLIFLYGVRNMLVSVTSAVLPSGNQPMVDVIWRRRQLAHGARIVAIGGGTGLSTLLRGLKEYTSNITAVVTVTDDGGSSGRLQREFNMLPPGDIRNCLVALADAEPLMQELFQHRFHQDDGRKQGDENGLGGHSFGNLLIAAMLKITGDFEEAIRQTSRVLAIRGRVLPSTTRQVRLCAEMEDGSEVEGETRISSSPVRIRRVFLSDPEAPPLEETLEAIRTADAIVIGPGSVYTSLVPNFLVRGVAEAVEQSGAVKIFVCNVMTQPGETPDFTASQHVEAVLQQAGGRALFDYVLVNETRPGPEVLERYAGVGARWVAPDLDRIRQMGLRPIAADLISESRVVRHDPEKLAAAVVGVIHRRVRPLLWLFDRRD